MKLQREELERTRKEFEKQNSTLKKQNFESTFFQMVRLHHEIVGAMVAKELGDSGIGQGRRSFTVFYDDLFQVYKSLGQSRPEREAILDKGVCIKNAWAKLFGFHRDNLGHYFGNLFTIFQYIKDSEIEDKRLYSNIVRAQLSDHELLILFYSEFGREKFKPFVEEFALFENLPLDGIETEHLNFYDKKAYGNKVV